jgi:hypothetical protein
VTTPDLDPRQEVELQIVEPCARADLITGHAVQDPCRRCAGILELDPRQPSMDGWLPGTIEHQVKVIGSGRVWRGLISRWFTLQATLDVHNVFDNQVVYLIEGGHNDPEVAFGEAKARVEPRHWQVGVRATF